MTKAKPKQAIVKTPEEIAAGESAIRVWTYTINNYTEEELAFVKLLVEPSEVKRHVCGIEVGENGTPHLQGAISWACAKRFTPMKKLFPRACIAKAIMTKDFSSHRACVGRGLPASPRSPAAPARAARTPPSPPSPAARSGDLSRCVESSIAASSRLRMSSITTSSLALR
ncbi:hypothetical protein T492DRAFT_950752 [Pavlovales sp. CCMP2436]|nr:hypothetical protein T492DRAFT_950752 [Pavlovales sp. CCMP2436]